MSHVTFCPEWYKRDYTLFDIWGNKQRCEITETNLGISVSNTPPKPPEQ